MAESPFDMCLCGWSRIQHCATPPHPCTHERCWCKAFCFAPNHPPKVSAIKDEMDMAGARFFDRFGLYSAPDAKTLIAQGFTPKD